MARSLQQLRLLQVALHRVRRLVWTRFWGMTIDPTAIVSLKAHLDTTYPRGVHIGAHSYVTFGVTVLCHDRTRGIFTDTVVGENCFIGARSILMPGITVGDGSIVGAGAVVTRDVPAHSIVAGNPARVIRSDITVQAYGRYPDADEVTYRLIAEGKYVK